MYNPEIIELTSNCYDKRAMISLGVNKAKRKDIIEATSWLPEKVRLKSRCVIIQKNYTLNTFPACKLCNKHVKYDVNDDNSFNEYCSDICRKQKRTRLDPDTYKKLASYDWLYEQRITLKKSYITIGEELNCSELTVTNACENLNIPYVNYLESEPEISKFLKNKEWLYEMHVVQKKTCQIIADEIGSRKGNVWRWLKFHNIPRNKANSYNRSNPRTSKEEIGLLDYIKSMGFKTEQGNRTILDGSEIDILIPEKNIGIEYNGIYSHIYRPHEEKIAARKDKNYHLNKTLQAASKGIELIHIFSDDWTFRQDIVKSILSSKLGKNKTIYARKCNIVELSAQEKKIFLDANHIQGNVHSSIALGLMLNDELVAVMTFCKSRYNKNYDWELSRFANKKFINVVGGFSKLLKAFRKNNIGSIISYADRSRSNGDVYRKNGFRLIRTNGPSYQYINFNKSIQRQHKSNFRKAKLKMEPCDTRTEFEVMAERKYHKIFDCGTLTFVMT